MVRLSGRHTEFRFEKYIGLMPTFPNFKASWFVQLYSVYFFESDPSTLEYSSTQNYMTKDVSCVCDDTQNHAKRGFKKKY